ncbi:YusG family protein [Geobacillus subterraneus]|uniref:YusG family protein n=1 Tax=Geobacillus subterraneus TaxID=129338 RepID=UPI001442B737|nr:YusG family protein [Geobacillus subterraneus]QIZ68862.1 YusG family protein [Geobacillus subterraneus]WPZ17971.1 YusG family protein [Geobacillus subterraneus]
MALQRTRIDITDRVIGKLNGRSLDLYEEGELIGRFPLPAAAQLKNGYTEQNGKIYKDVTATVEPDQKYVDCDGEAGWC